MLKRSPPRQVRTKASTAVAWHHGTARDRVTTSVAIERVARVYIAQKVDHVMVHILGHGHGHGHYGVDLDGSRLVRDDTEIEEGLRHERARQVVKQDARVVGRVPGVGRGVR